MKEEKEELWGEGACSLGRAEGMRGATEEGVESSKGRWTGKADVDAAQATGDPKPFFGWTPMPHARSGTYTLLCASTLYPLQYPKHIRRNGKQHIHAVVILFVSTAGLGIVYRVLKKKSLTVFICAQIYICTLD